MWTNTIEVRFRGIKQKVQVWLSESKENSRETVSIQAMVNEYFLIEEIDFPSRDAAYSFIKNYNSRLGLDFLQRGSMDACA